MKIGTVLITGARAPVALHLARLLFSAGCRVHLADSLHRPLAAASALHHGYHRLPPFGTDADAAAEALARLIEQEGIDCVIPTCEEVLWLALIWRDHAMPAPLFAPDFARLEEVHNKAGFIALCRDLGHAVPQTTLLRGPEDVVRLAPEARHLVFKPVWSRFATRTMIRPDPSRLSRIHPSPERPWVAQDFIAGQELCAYAIARAGRVSALSVYRGMVRAGAGASISFAPVEDAGVSHFVADFVAAKGWTGQISFDLIRRADGTVLPIECNPRATSGLHFFRDPAGFAKALAGGSFLSPDVTRAQGVRLALWLYGLPGVFKPGGLRRFRAALRDTDDVMDWSGDRLTIHDQLRSLAEFARIAARHRIGLQAASTHDIEWNGAADQSSIS
jgi:NAD(P)-dependent dehydrogenase (short-subunit alcohol dehydrogenase family)